MKVPKNLFFPLLVSIIFSSHCVIEMSTYSRRTLAILTLGIILWFIYNHLKEPDLEGRFIIIICIIVVTSGLLVLGTLIKTGW